jgi:polysaccharide export outer membrane protein
MGSIPVTSLSRAPSWAITIFKISPLVLLMTILSGCGSSLIASGGPTSSQVIGKASKSDLNIQVIDLDATVTRRAIESDQHTRFSETLGASNPVADIVNRGDVVDLSIWEAPPAVLFSTASGINSSAPLNYGNTTVSNSSKLLTQIVDGAGRLDVPFVGYVLAAGRSPQAIGTEIQQRLAGKAHQPQVLVSIARNTNQTVTVLGDIAQSGRMALTSRGERLLDILALAGGVKQPVSKTTIRITRRGAVQTMPLDSILRDPAQNVVLQPDDVVTAFFQPYSFTVLGAAGQNNEINFEGTGLTLAQALGRMGGLQDNRANVKGVFIFRLERLSGNRESQLVALKPESPTQFLPVIYRVNMTNPSTLFLAQQFPIRDKDVIYISNAPTADFQKFFGIIANIVLPIASAQVLLNQ